MQTTDYNLAFQTHYKAFQQTDLFHAMSEMVENNDWHLEANVGVHTQMVVGQYVNSIDGDWTHEHFLGAIACMLHDIGKPVVCEQIIKDDGTIRLTSPGHELESARMAEDFLVTNITDYVELSAHDIFSICWLIQNHLFYKIQKKQKLKDLRMTSRWVVSKQVSDDNFDDIFVRCITADALGRLGVDDEATKVQLYRWIDMYNDIGDIKRPGLGMDKPTMAVLIGPSGVGKSTYVKKHLSYFTHYSWDDLRVAMFKTDAESDGISGILDTYQYCWAKSVSDEHEKTFKAHQIDELRQIVAARQDVVIDNTNLSQKARAAIIQQAKQKGYNIVGVTFPISIKMLTDRLAAREDRDMDPGIVINMYKRLALPSLGQWFDGITVSDGNLWTQNIIKN